MNGVAEDGAEVPILEDHRIPEAGLVGVGEEELPMGAGVGGLVEAGQRAGAGGHHHGRVCVPSPDAAEVELGCVGRSCAALPVLAAVSGAEDGSVGSAGPCDFGINGVNSAEPGCGVAGLHLPWTGGSVLRGERRGWNERQYESNQNEKPTAISHARNGNAGIPDRTAKPGACRRLPGLPAAV